MSTIAKAGAGVIVIGLLASLLIVPFLMRAAAPSQSSASLAGARTAEQPVPSDAPAAQVQGVGTLVTDAECIGTASSDDRLTPTTENVVKASDAAVVGTVTSVDGPRWNTPDGSAVKEAVSPYSVYRTVTVKVDDAIKGVVGTTYTFRVPGGKVGCSIFAPEGIPLDIEKGQSYAFFTQDLPAADAKGASVPTVTDVWPVTAGAVLTPIDGKVSVEKVVAEGASSK